MKTVSVAGLLMLALLVVSAALRFVSVADSPPGFYIDEAAISAQVICVRQSAETLQGQTWPLFSEVLGGGYATPVYVYPAAAWTFIFGDSVASFRGFTAFFSLLFIIGTFVFAKRFWKSNTAGVAAALAASVSPWVFQFARIAWDPSLAPAYSVWGFAFLFASEKHRRWQLIASGFFFSFAAYCYPPLRVQLAITIPLAVLLIARREKRFDTLLSVGVAGLVSIPLIVKTLSGEIQGRFQMLSVFNSNYLMSTYSSTNPLNGLRALGANLISMLGPDFLIFHGDANLRHSTGSFGVWSWLDAFAVACALAVYFVSVARRGTRQLPAREILFCLVGYLAGLLPAAMTWESNPHALRSFGAVVFLALGSGGALAFVWSYVKPLRPAVVGVAFASFLSFVHVYFTEYPERASLWFDTQVVDLARELKSENRLGEMNEILRERAIEYDPRAVAYYQLAGGAVRCPIRKSASEVK